MLYHIYNALDMVDKEERLKIVETAFDGKQPSIPIKPLADFVVDGLKELLLEFECLGDSRPIQVKFVDKFEGEINFKTDVCEYLTANGTMYYAWVNGNLNVTDEEISLICEVICKK